MSRVNLFFEKIFFSLGDILIFIGFALFESELREKIERNYYRVQNARGSRRDPRNQVTAAPEKSGDFFCFQTRFFVSENGEKSGNGFKNWRGCFDGLVIVSCM